MWCQAKAVLENKSPCQGFSEGKIDYNIDTMLCQAKVVVENKKPCQGFSVKKNRRWTLDFDRNVDNSISDPLFIWKLKWIIDSLLSTI